jgi:hypothetical protein
MQQIDSTSLSPIRIPKEKNENEEKKKSFYTNIISLLFDCFSKPKEDD